MKHCQSCAELSPRFMGRFKIIIILDLPINLSCLSHFYLMQTTLEETMRRIFRKKILSRSLFLAFYSTHTMSTTEQILPCDSPLPPSRVCMDTDVKINMGLPNLFRYGALLVQHMQELRYCHEFFY